MSEMDRYLGKILNDKYEIIEVVGIGGMSVVYKAKDLLSDRIVAVKILKDEFVADEKFRKRFINESRVIAMLAHKNIVDVFDVNIDNNIQYIVMEYIDGITLKQYMNKQGPLEWKEAIYFVDQILNGLSHAHERGIIHRDIKPHNIMLLPDGTIKVTDFGIARIQKFDTVTLMEKAIGTVHYISPEQASKGKMDEKSDIYSVGIMLYEMVTGVLPFEGDSPVTVALKQLQEKPKKPSEINSRIPKGLEEIILKAMCKNAENRFLSAHEMQEALEKVRENPDIVFGYKKLDESLNIDATKEIDSLKKRKLLNNRSQIFSIPVLAGVLSAFIFAAVIFSFINFLNHGPDKIYIDVPYLIGKTYASVMSDSSIAGNFTITQTSENYSDIYEAGVIMSQKPEKNTQLLPGSTIEIIVSKGIKTETVIDVTDMEELEATLTLTNLGFKVDKYFEYSSTVDANNVIKTDPVKGTVLAYGSTIKVYLSKGPQTKVTLVPDVLGKYKVDALEILRSNKLSPKVVGEYSDTVDFNKVIRQSINSNVEVSEYTEVIIYVSIGPEPMSSTPSSVPASSSPTSSNPTSSNPASSSPTSSNPTSSNPASSNPTSSSVESNT